MVTHLVEDEHGGPEGERRMDRLQAAMRKVRGELSVPLLIVFRLFPLHFNPQADDVLPSN